MTDEQIRSLAGSVLTDIRAKHPLILSLTNSVVQPITANT